MYRTINKYRPRTVSGFVGREKTLTQLKHFVVKNSLGKGLILHGRQGVGKTAAVYVLAEELNYEVVELNASEPRNKANVLDKTGLASQQMSLFNKGKIILIDDVDVLSSKDRGAIASIKQLIKDSKWPVILTATEINDKIKDLKRCCVQLKMDALDYNQLFVLLKSFCEKENICYNEQALKMLARSSDGDVRAALLDLQMLALNGRVNDLTGLAYRNQKELIEQALLRVFKSLNLDTVLNAFDNIDMDAKDIMLWLSENLPKEYSGQDLALAYNKLSMADVYMGRIMRRQYWRFLVYIYCLLSAGIALAKNVKNNRVNVYTRSQLPLKIWIYNAKNQKRKVLAEKVAKKLHVSKHKAFKDILPYLKILYNNGYAQGIEHEFSLEDEKDWFLK